MEQKRWLLGSSRVELHGTGIEKAWGGAGHTGARVPEEKKVGEENHELGLILRC